MKRKVCLFVFALLLVGVVPALAQYPSYPISEQGIQPLLYFSPGPGISIPCDEVGDFEFSSGQINYYIDTGEFDGPFPAGITASVTNNVSVGWSSSFGIGAVLVSDRSSANVYEYNPQLTWDGGLSIPLGYIIAVLPTDPPLPDPNFGLTFCWNPEEDQGQWCSPGYWRQEHHLESWLPTGYEPDDLFFEVFGYDPALSKKGLKDGAPASPTLWQVLQSPQWFGGDAFNLVGDLLSDSHPDVDFQGERVEDSCPLD